MRPSFFGCDSNTEAPFIIYIVNGSPPHNGEPSLLNQQPSNVSLLKLQATLDQSYLIGMQGHPAKASEALDSERPACLACAAVDRARNRAGIARSGICATCVKRYYWNGPTYGLETTTRCGPLGRARPSGDAALLA